MTLLIPNKQRITILYEKRKSLKNFGYYFADLWMPIIIGCACGGVALLLIVVVSAVCCYTRCRSHNRLKQASGGWLRIKMIKATPFSAFTALL